MCLANPTPFRLALQQLRKKKLKSIKNALLDESQSEFSGGFFAAPIRNRCMKFHPVEKWDLVDGAVVVAPS